MSKFIDLAGQKFSKLTVIKKMEKDKYGVYFWLCQCECGNVKKIRGSHLKSGYTKSCGCLQKEIVTKIAKTYGMAYNLEYKSWANMKQRCLNKHNSKYKDWGGRGIKVCKRWLKFENFYKDMGDKPFKSYSIDRIDNSKGYFKENCRWATKKEQARNKRNNKMITYKGETFCLKEWSEKLNIKYSILQNRLNDKWDIKKLFQQPRYYNK